MLGKENIMLVKPVEFASINNVDDADRYLKELFKRPEYRATNAVERSRKEKAEYRPNVIESWNEMLLLE
jgi:hypothetical protein